MLVREKLHKLIDEIKDDRLLNEFLTLFSSLKPEFEGQLYNSLSQQQKDELLLSFTESLDSKNLIEHNEVKAKIKKWL